MNTNKPTFLYGMGTYKPLKGFTVPHIDWNTGRITPKLHKPEVLVGFSMGAVLACEYAIMQKVDHLILCSITTGIETLKKVKANKVTFLVGEKEEWVYKDIMRIMNTLPNECIVDVHVIPGEDHKITEKYRKKIISLV